MSLPFRMNTISVDEYLETEQLSPVRREFIDGHVFAMTGATDAHNVICVNLVAAMHQTLEGTGCRVYQNDMKVRIRSANCFFYPDVLVSCEPVKHDAVYKESPVVIIEVTSKSSKKLDTIEKLEAYKTIPSLREYAVISQERKEITLHRKIDTCWEALQLLPPATLVFESFPGGKFQISLEDIYADTDN